MELDSIFVVNPFYLRILNDSMYAIFVHLIKTQHEDLCWEVLDALQRY